jgi:hypothetical protein
MRAALAVLAMISIAMPAVGAEAPFVPPGVTPPDYVATVVEKDAYGPKTRNWTIMHHGDWSRASLDPEQGGHTEYYATNDTVRITTSANHIGFSRPSRYDRTMDYEPRNMGERQTYLNEACTVWDIERPKPGQTGSPIVARLNGLAMARLSCVTNDGIELWQKRVYQDSTSSQEATRIERRPVPAEDTAPPPRLALDWWDKHAPAPAASDIPDHEVVMKLSVQDNAAATSVSTHLRSGQWTRTDTTQRAQRHIRIVHEPSQFSFSFSTDENGRPSGLYVARPDEPADPSARAKVAARSLPGSFGSSETVLGENCRWFSLETGAEGGLETCLAPDNVILAEKHIVRPFRTREWTAVSVTRRAVAPEEMRPPAEMFDPQTWLAR